MHTCMYVYLYVCVLKKYLLRTFRWRLVRVLISDKHSWWTAADTGYPFTRSIWSPTWNRTKKFIWIKMCATFFILPFVMLAYILCMIWFSALNLLLGKKPLTKLSKLPQSTKKTHFKFAYLICTYFEQIAHHNVNLGFHLSKYYLSSAWLINWKKLDTAWIASRK